MNLNQIDIKNFILALFKRDDGERILLGAGAYDFKDSLQHFQANIIANDVIEKQGTDGQLLAGQVRRCQTQTFEGYIGDASTSRIDTEDYRRKFIQFFRTNHFYTVIYIMPNGEAIQRKNGYLVEAPSAPEQYQRFPEYSVGFQFEDLNYYTYSEDDQGDETYAQTVDIMPEGNLTGGLVWDGDGVVWSNQGKHIAALKGDTYQVTTTGKNLFTGISSGSNNGIEFTLNTNGTYDITGKATAQANKTVEITNLSQFTNGATYTLSATKALPAGAQIMFEVLNGSTWVRHALGNFLNNSRQSITGALDLSGGDRLKLTLRVQSGYTVGIRNLGAQIEKSASATSFEPYTGGAPAPSPSFPESVQTVTGLQTIAINGTDYPLDLGAIELAKLGTAQDRIYRDGEDWKIHKEIATRTFNGTDTDIHTNGWFKSSETTSTTQVAALDILSLGARFVGSENDLMQHFSYVAVAVAPTNGKFKLVNSNAGKVNHIRLAFSKSEVADLVAAKAWMATNRPQLYFIVYAPTDTAITDANLIAQLDAIDEALEAGGTTTVTPAAGNRAAIITTQPSGNGGAVWEASGGHSTNTITVGGLFAVQPVWEIIGPAESPVLENITDGTSLGYVGSIPAGQTLTIDCRAQTATLAGANVKNNVRGTWQSFEPGEVIIRYSGANVTSASTLKWNEVIG